MKPNATSSSPAKSNRQLFQSQLDIFPDTRTTREQIRADVERWKSEKAQGFKTPPFKDERRLAALAVLDFKIGLEAFALAREDERDAEALAVLNTMYAGLLNEADAMLEKVRVEAFETHSATAAIDCESEDLIPTAAETLFRCSEIGRRLIEANIERPYGPIRSEGEAVFMAAWYDRAVRILADWENRKLRAGKIPAGEIPTQPTAA
jgi:hypothetical protein